MLSRRDLIGKVAVGAAAVVAVGAVGTRAAAATRPLHDSTAAPTDPTAAPASPLEALTAEQERQQALEPAADAVAVTAPPPWALVAPFAAGSVVAHDWHLADLTPVQDGSAVATLQNGRGRAHRVHLCRNDGSPQGIVSTRRVDLVVMNQGYGDLPTEEHLGQAVAALAHAVAANETTVAAGVFTELLPHVERVQRFAAVDGPSADGKLR